LDLHLIPSAVATDDERAAVDSILDDDETQWRGGDAFPVGHVARGGHEARERRHLLLPALHALTDRVGWISPGGVNYVSQRLTVAPADVYGVATFYALFSTEARATRVVHVCDDIACRVNGAEEMCRGLEERFGPPGTALTNAEGDGVDWSWQRSPCLGQCQDPVAAFVQEADAAGLERGYVAEGFSDWGDIVEEGARLGGMTREPGPSGVGWGGRGGWGAPQTHHARHETREDRDPNVRLLRRVGVVDPSSLEDYRAHGGYEALRRAVGLGPEGVISELKDSKLLGRGGAAFPAGVKWEAVARQPVRPHYFVCNADESEPGTFKDRVVMEHDPFAVVEALTIAGYATGSETAYLYIRGEYPLAQERLQGAIDEARRRGFLGEDVMGEGFAFDVEIRRGAGAYICGEETSLFNSIEGKRGEPRNKPPFPVEKGLFAKPTGINNVETLVNVLEVLRIGGLEYAKLGTESSTGTRLFCLSGCVETAGLYEVEHGTTLGELIELAGGVRGGRELRAVLLGGAAGTFVGPDALDMPLTFEDAREQGTTLGSGVVMLFDDTVDLRDIVVRIAAFFRDESCGQCVPCRVGTVRQEEALHRLLEDRPLGSREDELALIAEIGDVMRDASICGLGQLAMKAVESAIGKLGVFTTDGSNGHGERAVEASPDVTGAGQGVPDERLPS
jgi:NADH-quinone oxidoreductase subunit F